MQDNQLTYTGPLASSLTVEAKHPVTGLLQEASVIKIFDKSQYTVVFDDGDITTLRRNALRMKSGKHFNASESLDNLPLTHPEHFGTPVGSRKKKFGEEEEEEEESTDDEADSVPYISKLGTVVCVEVTDKKSSKAKENWFPGLVVSPHSQDQEKINTKKDFLVRSFKDHRYYTVPKTECKKFHKDLKKGVSDQSMLKAIEHAEAYLHDRETLPVHWDKDILFDMRDESTTEGESEDEELLLSDDEDAQSPEEKDHLVAELYKHMDDRGSPINKTPTIGEHEVDLYKLFKFVQKLCGYQRVTNNNQWRIVAKKLGFETNWCINQVKVIYKRYLLSFEELYRTLGCTLINHPRSNSMRVRHGSGRPLMRGVRVSSKVREEDGSDKSSIGSQEETGAAPLKTSAVLNKKDEVCDEIDLDLATKPKSESTEEKRVKQKVVSSGSAGVVDKIIKDESQEDEETEIFDSSKKVKEGKQGKKVKEERMLTRPRRDSNSSLAAATELKAKKDEIGESSKMKKESKKEIKKIKEEDEKSDSGSNGSKGHKSARKLKKKEEEPAVEDEECNSDLDNVGRSAKKKLAKKKGGKSELAPVQSAGVAEEEPQHLKPSVECSLGDKIKVFWLHGQIYEAKIIKVDKPSGVRWPKYFVHYQGWNQRHDEWITRGRIAENLTWNANPKKASSSSSAKSNTPPPVYDKPSRTSKSEKTEKRSSDEEEKRDSDEKPEEDREIETRRKSKTVRSSTPSSTPGSSRTSSPAHNKRSKSPPASKKTDEKTPVKEKKGLLQRTSSPAQRKSPLLKRQSSRNSLNKQSDDDMEVSDVEEEEERHTRRSSKLEKVEPTSESKAETSKRSTKSSSTTPRSESKAKKQAESEKEEEKKQDVSKSVGIRSRRSATPTKKLRQQGNSDSETDPYVFQEPEPFVKIENISAADIAKHSKVDIKEAVKAKESPEKKHEKEEDVKIEEVKKESTSASDSVTTEKKDEKAEDSTKDVKTEIKEEEDGKSGDPKSSSYDRYANLFPHLVSLRTGQSPPAEQTNTQDSSSNSTDPELSSSQLTSASMITSIVESTILKETSDSPKQATADTKETPGTSVSSKEEVNLDSTPPKPEKTKTRRSKKFRNLRKPAHKSAEVVTDSDSESDVEAPKTKPLTPRRKAAVDAEKLKTPAKRAKEVDSDDEDVKKSKKLKEAEDESLVCEETLPPGSPVQVETSEKPGDRSQHRQEERARLDMPFASVASSSAPDKQQQPHQISLKSQVESPPATPESSNSLETPLTRSARRDDGRKSPAADSSEVDLESLSGRGKAGSEDSRMDVECSSSSDTRRKRRHVISKETTEKESDKSVVATRNKRKRRGDNSARGRGSKGRGRNSSGVGRGVGRNVEESDDSEKDQRAIDEQRLERLDNVALAELAKPKPNSTSKYNFFVMLGKFL